MSALTDFEMMRLARALTAKHVLARPGVDRDLISSIVHTTVGDVLLVVDGDLTIDQYEQPGSWASSSIVGEPPPVRPPNPSVRRGDIVRMTQGESPEPPPVEVIGDLDWIDYQESRFLGPRVTLTGRRRRRAMLKHATHLLDEGTAFVFDGRRIPGRNS